MRVLIAGGGIGGLSAALCCLHYGHDVVVFERSSEFGDVGAGIQITPNAMKVLEVLGVADRIAETAFYPEAIEARMGESGRYIFSIPLGDYSIKRWGSPYTHIHRSDYIKTLSSILADHPAGRVELDAELMGYQNSTDGVSVSLKNGRKVSGDILIGADGIKSVIRQQMLGPDAPVFTGNVAWRAVVPIKALGKNAPDPTACVWFGRGRHCVTYRIGGGSLANFVGVVERDDWQGESWTELGTRNDLLQDFGNWHPVISEVIETAKPSSLYRWALFDRAPLKQWVDGRVVLLGDAAHPMLPFLAQGAAMAVEDAWVLATEISKFKTYKAEALANFRAKRLARVSKMQSASKSNMKIFHQQSRLGQILNYGAMSLAGKISPNFLHSRMDWIYAHDVVSS